MKKGKTPKPTAPPKKRRVPPAASAAPAPSPASPAPALSTSPEPSEEKDPIDPSEEKDPIDPSEEKDPIDTTIETFAKDFLADLPHEAHSGTYAPSVRDRWHDRTFDFEDGDHEAGGWTFTFANQRLVHAARLTAPAAA
jgi:hypothetical protein